jgi:ATP-dependent DNA helicase RecG
MSMEGQDFDKKSLRVIKNGEYQELAKDCVAFANAIGGRLLIGIEDKDELPPPEQRIANGLLDQISKRISQLTLNIGLAPHKITAKNGGEYLELTVFRSHGIAATSDGRYFIRVADETRPLLPDDFGRLMNDKTAYAWETQTNQLIPRQRFDETKCRQFLTVIRRSERVTDFIKEKSDGEILEYYLLIKGEFLTNLGILWIGTRTDRATLQFAPVIQFLKYDETDRKVNKIVWDDFSLNPMELIEAVWQQIPDWRESYELPDGLFRKHVPHYDEVVVRELLANALVHRPYTQRGDIFLNLYPNRLEIHNPGLLPLGVTPRNILHTTIKRNEHLAHLFYVLKLMEREGSGYDRIYEVLLSSGKRLPDVQEGNDRVVVIVKKRILNPAIIEFIFKADQTFQLRQKEKITLGLIAQHESLTAQELARVLELQETADLKPWLGRLVDWEIVKTKGRTKGMEYFVEPDLLRWLDFQGNTTLKGIEKHRLRELILRDLEIYKEASIGEIHRRIGLEIPRRKVRSELQRLITANQIQQQGVNKWTRYLWTKKA